MTQKAGVHGSSSVNGRFGVEVRTWRRHRAHRAHRAGRSAPPAGPGPRADPRALRHLRGYGCAGPFGGASAGALMACSAR